MRTDLEIVISSFPFFVLMYRLQNDQGGIQVFSAKLIGA
jgi:hypothetical protein